MLYTQITLVFGRYSTFQIRGIIVIVTVTTHFTSLFKFDDQGIVCTHTHTKKKQLLVLIPQTHYWLSILTAFCAALCSASFLFSQTSPCTPPGPKSPVNTVD